MFREVDRAHTTLRYEAHDGIAAAQNRAGYKHRELFGSFISVR